RPATGAWVRGVCARRGPEAEEDGLRVAVRGGGADSGEHDCDHRGGEEVVSGRIRRWLIKQSLSDRRSGSFASRLRYRRWQLIRSVLRLSGTESVIDVGGTDRSWWFADWKGPVVRCNLDRDAATKGLRVLADGPALPFP